MLGSLLKFRLFRKPDNPVRLGLDCREKPVYVDFRSDFVVFTGVYERFSAYINLVLKENLPVIERAIVVDVEEEPRAFFMNGYSTTLEGLKKSPLPTDFSLNRISIRLDRKSLTSRAQDLLNFRVYEAVKKGGYSLVVINCPFPKWESLADLIEALRRVNRGVWLKTFSFSDLPLSLGRIWDSCSVRNRCFGLGWFNDRHLKKIAMLTDTSIAQRLSYYSGRLYNRSGFFFVREKEVRAVPFRWSSGKRVQEGEEFCRGIRW